MSSLCFFPPPFPFSFLTLHPPFLFSPSFPGASACAFHVGPAPRRNAAPGSMTARRNRQMPPPPPPCSSLSSITYLGTRMPRRSGGNLCRFSRGCTQRASLSGREYWPSCKRGVGRKRKEGWEKEGRKGEAAGGRREGLYSLFLFSAALPSIPSHQQVLLASLLYAIGRGCVARNV